MLKGSAFLRFRMSMGEMFVDFRLVSRDHKRVVTVEGAKVDPKAAITVAPLSWIEGLRSPSSRLPTGYFVETPIRYEPGLNGAVGSVKLLDNVAPASSTPGVTKKEVSAFSEKRWRHHIFQVPLSVNSKKKIAPKVPQSATGPNGVQAGPLVMYITGQTTPVVLNVHFVPDELLEMPRVAGIDADKEINIVLGRDAISQCGLFNEMRPGGLLSPVGIAELRKYGMKTNKVADSPLVARPWTKMKYMFIDEIQRGPKLTEFVGQNPRTGSPWRFSQHCKHFRVGIWRETIRKGEMHEGLHAHSSYQKSHQQSVPEISFMAPSP